MREVPNQSYLGRDFVATASAVADPDHEPYPAPSAGLFCLARLRAHDRFRPSAVNGRTSVTAEMALKLGATFRTTPEFWLNAQRAVDLHLAASRLRSLPESLRKAS